MKETRTRQLAHICKVNYNFYTVLTTLIIAFREFLEAFLIIGVFMGLSKKLRLKKEKEIVLAAFLGIVLSLGITGATYAFGTYAGHVLSEKNADSLESYLMIFSGFFIAYVILSLHNVFHKSRGAALLSAHKKLAEETFDISLFLTIAFLVIREGFEIALFTASVALFSTFLQNLIGLLLGFFAATVLGLSAFVAYVRFPIGKIFKWTEYMIILLGASLVQNGTTTFLETHLGINLSDIFSFHLRFLPTEDTLPGHILQSLLGIDRGFSAARLCIMGLYVLFIYRLFLKRTKISAVHEHRS